MNTMNKTDAIKFLASIIQKGKLTALIRLVSQEFRQMGDLAALDRCIRIILEAIALNVTQCCNVPVTAQVTRNIETHHYSFMLKCNNCGKIHLINERPEEKLTLRQVRERCGMLQKEAALKAGIGVRTIRRWERDSSRARSDLLFRLLNVYRVSSNLIHIGQDPKQKEKPPSHSLAGVDKVI